jgi:CRISPR-associated protein Cmr2
MRVFWQSKIWGLLHDPVLKALHGNSGRGTNSLWASLAVMADWDGLDPEASGGKAMQQIKLADLLASASDRGAIGSLSASVDYAGVADRQRGLEIKHLLSGASLEFKVPEQLHQRLIDGQQPRRTVLESIEQALFALQISNDQGQLVSISDYNGDPQKLFWWLWRCLPIATSQLFHNDPSLLLMPAETRIPDGSIWSHTSITAALAGALTGTDLTLEDLKQWPRNRSEGRAYLATFTFTPIQELIKASRKMRDFWAGSWILHYLSARVCWKLAQQYGPDSLVYPCLFQQPLIDTWLLEQWPDFAPWITAPSERQLLTAGFPNVIVLILPEAKVASAMQYASQILKEEWLAIADLVFQELQTKRWMPALTPEHPTWQGWLKNVWQSYWSAMPIGDPTQSLTSSEIYQAANSGDAEESASDHQWRSAQNQTFQVNQDQQLFQAQETHFLQKAAEARWQRYQRHPFKANVGSWWPHIFDRTRAGMTAAKNARSWQIPTAFDSRSTISGIGPIVHPYPQRQPVTAAEANKLWQKTVGLFDGREQLNATEVVKRGLHFILSRLVSGLGDGAKIDAAFPDLTGGVAGYLKTQPKAQEHFQQACQQITQCLPAGKLPPTVPQQTGIPWLDDRVSLGQRRYHPRQLSPGWLIEDVETATSEEAGALQQNLQRVIDRAYPGNNPADWYVLGAGDGDDLSQWLRGNKLKTYDDYIPEQLRGKIQEDSELGEAFRDFLTQTKRMGPATHGALSRALLDFSNQLVPYLTEQRYAGRLVYSGGDDVLAYLNLWEWDRWLWDVRQCFRGDGDPLAEFDHQGDYWRWRDRTALPNHLDDRPLFTMGNTATISFGVVIANQSVPLAIALEHLWAAEAAAKEHLGTQAEAKDAVQIRVLYGNGNVLSATAKFTTLPHWQALLSAGDDQTAWEPALFEQATEMWLRHPVPSSAAIRPWVVAFSDRRAALTTDTAGIFVERLSTWLTALWKSTPEADRDREVRNWLKLAAFVLRKRQITLGSLGGQE